MAQIISYERRVYESVDDDTYLRLYLKNQRKKKERMQQRVKEKSTFFN